MRTLQIVENLRIPVLLKSQRLGELPGLEMR